MSNSGLKLSARSLMLKNAPKLFFIAVVYLIVITLLPVLSMELSGLNAIWANIIDQMYQGHMPDLSISAAQYRPFGAVLSVVIALFMPVIEVGFLSYSLKVSREQNSDYRNLLDGFAMVGKVIWLSIVQGFFIFLWSLLFIVPGIIAAYRYSQAYFILLDNPELSAMNCIRESKKLMAGNKLDLFILDLSFLGWQILNTVAIMLIPTPVSIPLVMIWLLPYITITKAGFYNYLVRYNPDTGDAPAFPDK